MFFKIRKTAGWAVEPTTAMSIFYNGTVGIGDTTAPRGTTYNTVLETYKQSSYGHNIWSFTESDSVSNNELAWYFEWKHTDSGSDAQWPAAHPGGGDLVSGLFVINAKSQATSSQTYFNTGHLFRVGCNLDYDESGWSSYTKDCMTIKTNGTVGIGTSNPKAGLHIYIKWYLTNDL